MRAGGSLIRRATKATNLLTTTTAAAVMSCVAACSRSHSPTPPAASGGASAGSSSAPASRESVSTFAIASEVRWGERGEVLFLAERDAGERFDLLAWEFETGALHRIATVSQADLQRRAMEAVDQGRSAESIDVAVVLAGLPVAPRASRGANAASADDDLFARWRSSTGDVRREAHADWGTVGGVRPSSVASADGLFVALGTESEIAVIRTRDGRLTTLRGSQNRELRNALISSGMMGGRQAALRSRKGTLVWGPVAAASGKVGFAGWPHAQLRVYADSPSAAIVLRELPTRDTFSKSPQPMTRVKKAQSRLLVPDAEHPRLVDLPPTPATLATYADQPPVSTFEQRLAIDEEASWIAWYARAVPGKWTLRRIVLASGASSDVVLETSAPHLFHSQASEMPFSGPRAPLPRPGRDAVFTTVSAPPDADLLEVDFATKSVRRYPRGGDPLVVAPTGDWLVSGTGTYEQGLKLVDVERGTVTPLAPCRDKPARGAATFSADGRTAFVALEGTNDARWSIGRYRVSDGGMRCDAVIVGPTELSRHVTALTATRRALVVLGNGLELGLFDSETGAHLADLDFGETWLAGHFADGALEVWGDERDANEALFARSDTGEGPDAGEPARWVSAKDAARVHGKLAPLLAP
jgi:hypothetical protein